MPNDKRRLDRLFGVRRWRPGRWAGWSPNGIGHTKPNHFGEMARVAWENRRNLPYAWRILTQGVCDGCALGTTGLRDFTLDGVHLCLVRLNLLKYNTMGALDPEVLADVGGLADRSSRQLRVLGRLPYPMVRRRGEPGFRRIDWQTALATAAQAIRQTQPDRTAYYLTSRGITNEVYYVAGKVARFLGTHNVDNSARLCHAPSTVGLKSTLGVAASTCSYKDWLEADLIVFWGSDVAQNQPVTTKYLYHAQQNGARIAVVNPYREPGMERYWIPSVTESALFGTKLASAFYQVHTGGDIAFMNGVMKCLIDGGGIDADFVANHTEGYEALVAALADQDWEMLERQAGISRRQMQSFAEALASTNRIVFVWSMGLTQHVHGTNNIRALVNLALARGAVGHDGAGLMPIRGHSGVQGGAEVGAVPNGLPGGAELDSDHAKEVERLWGFPLPAQPGLAARGMLDAAQRGDLDVLYAIGGNYLETLPDPTLVAEALAKVPVRIHQDIVTTSQMLIEPADTVLLLPAATRYEQPGGGTETTTERQIIFSPEIPGPRVGEARPEWEPLVEIAKLVKPDAAGAIDFADTAAIRAEIARTVPFYAGIDQLQKQGDHVQWGGRHLAAGGHFPRPGGRALFSAVAPPDLDVADGAFVLSTRRGKQFNSMVHAEHDGLTGAKRDHLFMAPADASRLGLLAGDRVVVTSPHGEVVARVFLARIRPRNVQMFWPEANPLIEHGPHDGPSGIPDYNARVEIRPFQAEHGRHEVEIGV